jgi:hypothetical protein
VIILHTTNALQLDEYVNSSNFRIWHLLALFGRFILETVRDKGNPSMYHPLSTINVPPSQHNQCTTLSAQSMYHPLSTIDVPPSQHNQCTILSAQSIPSKSLHQNWMKNTNFIYLPNTGM